MPSEQFSNNAQTNLNGAITAGATSLTVVSASGFPASAQFRIKIDNEIMIVTAGAGTTTWTVTRGAEGTTAAAHSDQATVTHLLTAAACDQFAQVSGGQLGGTGQAPDVRGLRETAGPTQLTMGAVADGEFLKRSGSTIISGPASIYTDEQAQDAVGTILVDTATIDFTYDDATPAISAAVKDDSVTDAKLRNSAGASVIGRSANSTGDPADIAAGGNDEVLRRVSDALGFGQLTVGMAPDGVWTYTKIQDISATSRVLGRKTAGAGDVEECTLSEILDFIGSAAQGDILYRGASGWARLAAGTSGYFLKTQGAGANPMWDAASGGAGAPTNAEYVVGAAHASLSAERVGTNTTGRDKVEWDFGTAGQAKLTAPNAGLLVPLATATASSSSSVDFTLTGLTNSDYEAYLVMFDHVAPATDNVQLIMRTSSDGGLTYDSGSGNYHWALFRVGEGGGTQAAGSGSDTSIKLVPASDGVGNAANETASGSVLLCKPSAAQYGTVSWEITWAGVITNLQRGFGSGWRVSAADVDAIRFLFSSGNIASGEFRLYGLKNAG